jgi:single-strand DNA-binding protein
MEMLTGRLTADAQIKTLKDKRQVITFSIAVNHFFSTKGEKRHEATFYNCSYWVSVKAADILKKGSIIQLVGRIGLNAYKTMDGDFHAFLTCHVNSFKIIHKSKDSDVGADVTDAHLLPRMIYRSKVNEDNSKY